MKPQPYGPTGAMTTKIGLGGAFLTRSSFTDGVATVRRALELSVCYFDTSPMYCRGASQAVLGEAPRWRYAPTFDAQMHYIHTGKYRPIRVYENVNTRFIHEDLRAKVAQFIRR